MPTFRHYGLREPMKVPGRGDNGELRPKSFVWEREWADPAPSAHAPGGAGYRRRESAGWSVHELSGVRVSGLKPGDYYSVQIVLLDEEGKEILWSSVVDEARAGARSGDEFFTTHRSLRSKKDQQIRWRIIYMGEEPGVQVVSADWIIREY